MTGIRTVGLALALVVGLAAPLHAQYEPNVTRLFLGTGECIFQAGSNSPQGVVSGKFCDTYWDTTSGVIYAKKTASGTTGWIAIDSTGLYDVRNYGAKGDGVTDDTAAIQAALDAVPAAGGVVFLPPGVYLISAPLNINEMTILRGSGYQGSEIRAKSTFAGAAMVQNAVQDGSQQFVGIESVYVNGAKAVATVAKGIYIKGGGQPTYVRDVMVWNISGNGIVIDGGTGTGSAGFLLENVWVASSNDHNLVLTGRLYATTLRHVTSEFQAAGKAAIYLDGTPSGIGRVAINLHDIHTEFVGADSFGVLISSFVNVLVDGLVYVGDTATGDLVKIVGLAADTNQIILRNLSVTNALAYMVNDTSRTLVVPTTDTTYVQEYTTGGAITSILRIAKQGESQIRVGEGSGTYYFDFGRLSAGTFQLQGNQTGNNNVVLAPGSGKIGLGTGSGTPLFDIEAYGAGSEPSLTAAHTGGIFGITNLNNFRTVFSQSLNSPYTLSIQHRHFSVDGLAYPLALNPLGGNVGIGTTTPTLFKLQTAGHVGPDAHATYDLAAPATRMRGGYFSYLSTDELHAKAFTADIEQALVGGQIIAKSVVVVAAAFTLPAQGASTTFIVEDIANMAAVDVFVAGDFVRFRQFTRGVNTLDVADAWGTISATAHTHNGDGTQTWTFVRSATPNEGTATGTITRGQLVIDYGVSGNGLIEATVLDGSGQANAPYTRYLTWTAHPKTGQVVRTQIGQLNAITSTAEFGLLAGTYAATNGQYFRASDQHFELHGIDLSLWDGATKTVYLDHATPALALGNPLPTAYGTGAGIWMGKDGGVYKARVGTPSGAGWFWDGSTLTITGIGTGLTAIDGGNIQTGTVTANAVSVGMETDNLISNPGAEGNSTAGWGLVQTYGGTCTTFAASAAAYRAGSYSFVIGADQYCAAGYRALPVTPGTLYTFRVMLVGSGTAASSLYLRMWEGATSANLSNGFVTQPVATSFTDLVANAPIPAGWTLYEYPYTVPAGIHWVTPAIYNWNTAIQIWFDQVEFRQQLRGVHIQDGAITADKITVTDLSAVAALIGGWHLDSTSIHDVAGVVGMSSAVTGGDDIRFWAGHATPASAPFQVTEAGALTASSGTIGGFTLGANLLSSGSGATYVAMSSGGTNAFWAGDSTFADAPFSVTAAGALKATSATITGTVNATAGFFGTDADVVAVSAAGLSIGDSGSIGTGSTTWASGTGCWMGNDSGVYKFRCSDAGTVGISWDGSYVRLWSPRVQYMPYNLQPYLVYYNASTLELTYGLPPFSAEEATALKGRVAVLEQELAALRALLTQHKENR